MERLEIEGIGEVSTDLPLREIDGRLVIELDGATTVLIGRRRGALRLPGQAASVVEIADVTVSRYHCRLDREGGDWWITDTGSACGLVVDDHRIPADPRRLLPGERVRIGSMVSLCLRAG